jgi:hypothetical protein
VIWLLRLLSLDEFAYKVDIFSFNFNVVLVNCVIKKHARCVFMFPFNAQRSAKGIT